MRSERTERTQPLWTLSGNDAASAERFVPAASRQSDRKQSEPVSAHPIEVDAGHREGSLDADYWLRHCQGFLVDSESGAEVGVVDDVELASDSDETVSLVVASGWFGRHTRKIAVADVLAILTSERRLIVSDNAARPRNAGLGPR